MSKQNTPWYDQGINQFDVVLIDKEGKEVLQMLNNDRMKFILKAVNNHERLVEALENVVNSELRFNHDKAAINARQLLTELKQQ